MQQLGVGSAPGKVILFGEHAVVYGRPALAAPVTQVCATAVVREGEPAAGLLIRALDLGQEVRLDQRGRPLAEAARLALRYLELAEPDWCIEVHSTIPIASGLGSGASVSVAIVRGLGAAAGRAVPAADVSGMAFEVEKLHHGTPSGVDNTVVAYGQPVYFIRGRSPEPFDIRRSFLLAIGDTGISSPTRVAVAGVRTRWEADPEHYNELFDRVGGIVVAAREAIAGGEPEALGPLMDANHELLQEMGVSCPELDSLVSVARTAGAGGAKLCGGGGGGNMIALVTQESADAVAGALRAAGAVRVIVTEISQAAPAGRSNGRTSISS